MILSIVSYGHDVLRQKCIEVEQHDPELEALITNMWETLYGADGCGLAAPQVNVPVRVFLVDSKLTYESMAEEDREYFYDGDTGIHETFINARIAEYSEDTWIDEEGCLSIPAIARDVERPWSITIEYVDRQFQPQRKTFSGITARMIQHEYDHIEGILYLDYLTPRQKSLLKDKLRKISEGEITAEYPMKFTK